MVPVKDPPTAKLDSFCKNHGGGRDFRVVFLSYVEKEIIVSFCMHAWRYFLAGWWWEGRLFHVAALHWRVKFVAGYSRELLSHFARGVCQDSVSSVDGYPLCTLPLWCQLWPPWMGWGAIGWGRPIVTMVCSGTEGCRHVGSGVVSRMFGRGSSNRSGRG